MSSNLLMIKITENINDKQGNRNSRAYYAKTFSIHALCFHYDQRKNSTKLKLINHS